MAMFNFFRRKKTSEKAESELNTADQLEDHRIAINENTNELQSNYQHLLEVESKVNKLAERVEEIAMFVGMKHKEQQNMPQLTTVEKEIFLALYTLCEQHQYTSYKDIAKLVQLSETLVQNYITILIEKGIPIIKNYDGDAPKLKISSYFKDLQTKENILKINTDISKQISLPSYLEK